MLLSNVFDRFVEEIPVCVATHGADKVEREVSDYFLADEIAGTYRGMMIAIPEKH